MSTKKNNFDIIERKCLSLLWMINIKVTFGILPYIYIWSTQEGYLWFYRELLILLTEEEHQWNRFKEHSLKTTNTLNFIKISENKVLKVPMNELADWNSSIDLQLYWPKMNELDRLLWKVPANGITMVVILW